MRPQDDRYFGGPERQASDWDRRSFDANDFDRGEGMYNAGGRDFSERLRNVDGREYQRDAYTYGETYGETYGGRPLERPWERQNFRRESASGEPHGFVEKVKSFFGIGPKGYRRTDERIREDVCEALARHPEINAADIEVKVKDGHVFLMGTIDNRWMKRQAEDAVAYVSGVDDVRNELTIPRNTDRDGEINLPRPPGNRAAGSGRKFSS